MIYWLCQPSSRSRSAIMLCASILLMFVILGPYVAWHIISILVLLFYMTYQLLSHHSQLPIALSVKDEEWRCYYGDNIRSYELSKGFVLGPLALIDFFNSESQKSMRLVLFQWDILSSTEAGASWLQLGTMLKYSKGPHQRPFSETNKGWFLKNGL